jgi:YHS domain-containing protein/thioredoxin-related protein
MPRFLSRTIRAGLVASLLFTAIGSPAGYAAPGGPATVSWVNDLARAQSEAKAQNRPLWIQFTGAWCHNCVRMDRETFVEPGVADRARARFVTAKLRADEHEQLALSYGFTSLPATVIIKPTGEVIAKREGFAAADEFVAFLDQALVQAGVPPGPSADGDAAGKVEPALALAGYCAVSLVAERKLVAGQSDIMAVHEGRLYRFASPAMLKAFQNEPERYVPVSAGKCAVSAIDEGESRAGDPRWGAVYRGHLYLFRDAKSQALFLKTPARYAHVDIVDRSFCAHCWGHERVLVRGRPQYSLTRAGQVYLFPDLDHMMVSRTSPDTARR